MADRFSFGEVNLDVSAGRDRAKGALDPETPYRMLILGDFSGRANRGILEAGAKLASRRPQPVDRDNFEDVLAKLAPRIELPLDSVPLEIRFQELDDFHPDRIFERTAIFQKLRQMRERLSDPGSFPQTLTELGMSSTTAQASRPAGADARRGVTSHDVEQMASGDLLARAIDESEEQVATQRSTRAPDELRSFVQRIVQPHLTAKADPRQPELLAVLDRATSDQMRALLHIPDFQALEAAWRALAFLVRGVETGEQLKIYLLDISKAELAADLAVADLSSSGLCKLLVEQTVRTPGAQPWALLVGNYTFEPTREDAELLGRMAKVASAAGAPFLAGASPRMVGCESIAELPHPGDWKTVTNTDDGEAWNALRGLPEAPYVGIAIPRFLLRLPYGKETDRTELFEFEEMTKVPEHEDYLWGHPAFALALLLAEAFSREGWSMRPNSALEIDGLPLHTYRENGESRVKPCSEALLTQDAAEAMLDRGLMPLVSYKDQDVVRLLRFQSIAEPLASLAGRWA